eukprot:COSAG04_NODE_372_length_15668_cov_11.135975_16_plen_59_part_00
MSLDLRVEAKRGSLDSTHRRYGSRERWWWCAAHLANTPAANSPSPLQAAANTRPARYG